MPQPTQPLPASTMALIRYLVAILLPLAVQRGWVGSDMTVDVAVGVVVPLVTVAYGVWKTHDRQTRLSAGASGKVQ